jgi:uncharacterized repeat protein (TIGR02543 family)
VIITLVAVSGFSFFACDGGNGTTTTTYTVTYNGNNHNGGGAPTDSTPYPSGATVTVLGNNGSLTRTDHIFVGWNTVANGSGASYNAGSTFPIYADTILYAQWVDSRTTTTYTITYNGNTNTGGTAPAGSTYVSGATVTVLGNTGSLVKTDYTFAGWNTAANGSGTSYSAGSTFTINSNTTLYARWTSNAPVNYTLDGIWWSSGGEKITVTGATGILTQIGSLSPLGTDAVKRGHYKIGDQKWRSLQKTGDQTWSGQTLHIRYNESNPTVSLGTTWSDCTITMSADGQTITFASADSSGAYSYTYTRTYTPTSYSLEGIWEEVNNGSQITVSGSNGVRTRWSHTSPDAFHIDARNKGYSALGQQVWRSLSSSTGTRAWSGQVLHISFYTSNPDVAVGTQWTNCTITMSSNGQTIDVAFQIGRASCRERV